MRSPLSSPERPHSQFVFCIVDSPSCSFLLFLCLSSVSCLGGIEMGGRIYRSRRGLEVGGVGHAVVLFLSLGDTARRHSRRDGGASACGAFK